MRWIESIWEGRTRAERVMSQKLKERNLTGLPINKDKQEQVPSKNSLNGLKIK